MKSLFFLILLVSSICGKNVFQSGVKYSVIYDPDINQYSVVKGF